MGMADQHIALLRREATEKAALRQQLPAILYRSPIRYPHRIISSIAD